MTPNDLESPLDGAARPIQPPGDFVICVAFHPGCHEFPQRRIAEAPEQGLARLNELGGKLRRRFTRGESIDARGYRIIARLREKGGGQIPPNIALQLLLVPLPVGHLVRRDRQQQVPQAAAVVKVREASGGDPGAEA